MIKKLTKNDLLNFETKISKLYEDKKIKGPIHLSGNNENQLIKIFKKIKKNDWVFLVGEIIIMHYLKAVQQKMLRDRLLQEKV